MRFVPQTMQLAILAAICLNLFPRTARADSPAAIQVISKGTNSGTYQAFPDICRLSSGELICVFYAGYAHVSLPNADSVRGGRICAVRSRDEGRSWTSPEILYDGPDDD